MSLVLTKVKEWGLKALPFVAVLVVGGLAGWYFAPRQVETKTVEVIKTVEVVKTDTRLDELMTRFEQLNRDYQEMKNSQTHEKYHKVVVETTNVDGSKTKTTTIDRNVDTVVAETKREVEVKVVEVEKQVIVTQTETIEKRVEVEKLVEVKPVLPNWHVGVLAGVAPRFDSPVESPIMVGLEVERRLIGPVFMGGWVMGGSPVTGFKVTNAAVGLKVGVEF